MVDVLGPIDYDKIMEKIKAIIDANEFKVITIDSAGNVISDISLSALRDALLDNVKGAYRLGVKDLNLTSDDPELAVPSGIEVDLANMNLANKYFNYGVTRCHGNCVLKAGGKLKLCANSIFRFVR